MANTKSWQKVLFIGDSLTRGYDVPYGKGWVELLKAYFEKSTATNESAKITMVNAGVDGATLQAIYNIWSALSMIRPMMRCLSWVGLMIFCMGARRKIAIFQ